MSTTLWIVTAGASGVLCRYWCDRLLSLWFQTSFPLATLAVNLLGSFLIGCVYALLHERSLISKELMLILSVGFLGGLTTFSAFSLQALQMMERKQLGIAVLYLVGSPILGVICAFLGSRFIAWRF